MASDKIVVAVDGGQSSTLALAAALNGEILGVGWGGESNHIDEPGGVERLSNALNHSITSALANAGRSAEMVRGAVLGMTGVIVIAGTGAVAYGELADGRSAKSGGWGYLMGDEGSGYDLGIQALRAITQASDGRGPATRLVEVIPQHFGLDTLQALHQAIYSQKITRAQIAGLAAVVGRAAQAGDSAAQVLLQTAGEHLALAALGVIRQLGVPGMDIYTTGGVFNAGEWVLLPFREDIHEESPSSTVSPAAFSPIIGALLLADNVHSHPDEIAPYLKAVDSLADFDHMIVPVGKGLSMAYRDAAM